LLVPAAHLGNVFVCGVIQPFDITKGKGIVDNSKRLSKAQRLGVNDTESIALYMLDTGKHYTATTLARELGVSAQWIAGKLNNLEKSRRKYTLQLTDSSPRLYKCLAIKGHLSNNNRSLLNAVFA
jgi:transcriptional antiterminator